MLTLLEQKAALESALNQTDNAEIADSLSKAIDAINISYWRSERDELRQKIEDMQLRISQAIGFCRMYRNLNPTLSQRIENLLTAIK